MSGPVLVSLYDRLRAIRPTLDWEWPLWSMSDADAVVTFNARPGARPSSPPRYRVVLTNLTAEQLVAVIQAAKGEPK